LNKSICIHTIFNESINDLKIYTVYCNNYKKILKINKKFQESNLFDKITDECIKNGSLDLESLLVSVIKRIPRYCLYFNELIKLYKNNNEDDKDQYFEINNTLILLTSLSNFINENLKYYEKFFLDKSNKFLLKQKNILKQKNVLIFNVLLKNEETLLYLTDDFIIWGKENNNSIEFLDFINIKNNVIIKYNDNNYYQIILSHEKVIDVEIVKDFKFDDFINKIDWKYKFENVIYL
jgi:hypothetical protein